MDQKLYDKLVDDAERHVQVIVLRTEFWRQEEANAKSGKDEIMRQLMNQTAQAVLARKWLEFIKGRNPKN